MGRRKNVMGLHTLVEREQALEIASSAFEDAMSGNSSPERQVYLYGVLEGISMLSRAEGAGDLESQLLKFMSTLRSEIRRRHGSGYLASFDYEDMVPV